MYRNPNRAYIGVNLRTERVEVVSRTPTLVEDEDFVQLAGMHSDALDGIIWLSPAKPGSRKARAVEIALADTTEAPIGLGWTFRKAIETEA